MTYCCNTNTNRRLPRTDAEDIAFMTIDMIFEAMPEKKKEVFRNACYRNMLLTSTYILGFSELSVYKEGYYLTMTGTRSSFAVFVADNDGELVVKRKPQDSKLHYLWGMHWMNEMPIDQYEI